MTYSPLLPNQKNGLGKEFTGFIEGSPELRVMCVSVKQNSFSLANYGCDELFGLDRVFMASPMKVDTPL
jgi:hypothetical protein